MEASSGSQHHRQAHGLQLEPCNSGACFTEPEERHLHPPLHKGAGHHRQLSPLPPHGSSTSAAAAALLEPSPAGGSRAGQLPGLGTPAPRPRAEFLGEGGTPSSGGPFSTPRPRPAALLVSETPDWAYMGETPGSTAAAVGRSPLPLESPLPPLAPAESPVPSHRGRGAGAAAVASSLPVLAGGAAARSPAAFEGEHGGHGQTRARMPGLASSTSGAITPGAARPTPKT